MYNEYDNKLGGPKYEPIEKVIMYLSHNNKDTMVKTILNLTNQLEAFRALNAKPIEQRALDMPYPNQPSTLTLPANVRNVRLEF